MSDYVNKFVPIDVQSKIKRIINYFETGSEIGNYGNVTIYNDGKNNTKQITYGRSQTTEQGNLVTLIKMYVSNSGKYSSQLKPYVDEIGITPLCNDLTFIGLLHIAATDPIMKTTQDTFFDNEYFNPACSWFEKYKFTFPFSLLVIYDSYIQSGSIMDKLRQRFSAVTPLNGGDEKKWITQYVNVRDEFLENNPNKILQKSDYRTDSFIYAIRQNNWDLSQPFKEVKWQDRQELSTPTISHIFN